LAIRSPEGLATRKEAPGPPTILNDGHRRALAEIVEAGPIPASHGLVRWRIIDLAQLAVGRVQNLDQQAGAGA